MSASLQVYLTHKLTVPCLYWQGPAAPEGQGAGAKGNPGQAVPHQPRHNRTGPDHSW